MRIEYPHQHTKEEVYKRVDGLLKGLQDKYGEMVQKHSRNWNSTNEKVDFSFKTRGLNITGNIQLQERAVVLEGKLPLLAKPFKGEIESIIKEKLEEILG